MGGANLEVVFSVAEMYDGGIVAVGNAAVVIGVDRDGLILRLDANGVVLWSDRVGGPGDDRFNAVLPLADGGVVVAGRRTMGTDGPFDGWVVQYDAKGVRLNEHTFGGSKQDRVHGLVSSSPGRIALAGATNSRTHGNYDGWLLSLPLERLATTLVALRAVETAANRDIDKEILASTEQDSFLKAERRGRKALVLAEEFFGSVHLKVAKALHILAKLNKHHARLLEEQGLYDEAERLYVRSKTIREKILGSDHPDVAALESELAVLYKLQGLNILSKWPDTALCDCEERKCRRLPLHEGRRITFLPKGGGLKS